MAFTPKTWVAREVQYPDRWILTPTGTTNNEVIAARSPGIITTEGDLVSAENLNDLESRISAEFATKNQPNGYAGLDANGDLVQMPTAAQVGAISSGYVSIMANEDILAKCNAQSVSCNLYIAQGAINTPDSTWSSGVLNTTGVNSDCAITVITQYGKIYANKYTSGNWNGWTSKADYASGDIAWTTPALRNEIIIPNTSSIPSGLADGTIILKYTP